LEARGLRVCARGSEKAVTVAATKLLSGQHWKTHRAADEGQEAHAEHGHDTIHGA